MIRKIKQYSSEYANYSYRHSHRRQRNEKNGRHCNLPGLLVVFALVCISCWLCMSCTSSHGSKRGLPQRQTMAATAEAVAAEAAAAEAEASAATAATAADNIYEPENGNEKENSKVLTYEQLTEMSDDSLLLINVDHGVPQGVSGELANVSDYVRTLNTSLLLNKSALVMLKEMLDAAAGVGYNEFRVTEGYRTQEYQQELYDTAEDKSFVALPGHSEHQTGLAADISYSGVNIANSEQGKWLEANAYKYGFIQRYPKDKENITKTPYEPWHYRYVGQPHAYYCYDSGICFEEYIDYLKDYKEITITVDGVKYSVRYLSGAGESVEAPQNSMYSASLDNTGGVIVTGRGWESK